MPKPHATSLLFAAVVLSACYTTRPASPDSIRALRALPPAEDATAVDGQRLDPSSRVRFQRSDGSWTPYVKARHLRLVDDGVIVAIHEVPWEDVGTAEILGPTAEFEEALRTSPKPAGARVDATGGGLLLQAGPGSMAGWLQALPEVPGARWRLRTRARLPLPLYDDAELRAALGGSLRAADGLRFADLNAVELNNFNGGITFLTFLWATGTAPIGGPVMLVIIAPAGARAAPTVDVEDNPGRVFAVRNLRPPHLEDERPLFSQRAQRRSKVRFVVHAGAGTEPNARLTNASLNAGVGLRLFDIFELAAFAQPQWPAPRSTGGLLPGEPLAPGPPAHKARWFALARAGVHLEVDARRRLALPLAVEAGPGPSSGTQTRLRYGARVRPSEQLPLWVGLHPFNPTYTRGEGWTFPSMVELLYDL